MIKVGDYVQVKGGAAHVSAEYHGRVGRVDEVSYRETGSGSAETLFLVTFLHAETLSTKTLRLLLQEIEPASTFVDIYGDTYMKTVPVGEYTPGDWTRVSIPDCNGYVIVSDGSKIAEVHSTPLDPEVALRNAAIIASAKELMCALHGLLSVVHGACKIERSSKLDTAVRYAEGVVHTALLHKKIPNKKVMP